MITDKKKSGQIEEFPKDQRGIFRKLPVQSLLRVHIKTAALLHMKFFFFSL